MKNKIEIMLIGIAAFATIFATLFLVALFFWGLLHYPIFTIFYVTILFIIQKYKS